jgi:polar amino acid transport system substrate-binding protein
VGKRKLTRGFLGVFLGLMLVLSGCTEPKTEDKLIFGVCSDYPPFEYNVKGKLVGFDVDLGRLIAKELGKQAEFRELQFSGILAALQTGRIDAAISTITITEARKKNFDFSVPYYLESMAVIFMNTLAIHNPTDLIGKKVACQLGTTMEFWLKKQVPEAEIITMDSNPQAVEALKAGHVHAVLIDTVQAEAFVRKNAQLSFKIIAQADAGYGVAFKKGDALRVQVNQALNTLVKKGAIEDLKKKYLQPK